MTKGKETDREMSRISAELRQARTELNRLGSAAQEAAAAIEMKDKLDTELKQLKRDYQKLAEVRAHLLSRQSRIYFALFKLFFFTSALYSGLASRAHATAKALQ